MTMHELTPDSIRALLGEISEELAHRGTQAHMFIVGGAAMALGYDARRVTQDVDAVFSSAPTVRAIAATLAEQHQLDQSWLNDGAKGFMPGDDPNARTVFESSSLLVQVASPEYLLAMKLHSGRAERDIDDAVVLFNALGYDRAEQAFDLLERLYPGQLQAKHTYITHEVVARATQRSRDEANPLIDTLRRTATGQSHAEETRTRHRETGGPER